MNEEIWKDVVGYEGLYQISNIGRLKSIVSRGHYPRDRLLQQKVSKGYFATALTNNNGCRKYFWVHRLVAAAFIPNPENKPQVNHMDCDRKNNNVSNLEWCTPMENYHHAKLNGRLKYKKGEDNSQSKITSEMALQIFNDKDTHVNIAAKYGLYPATVGCIKRGDSWAHVTGLTYKRKRLMPADILQIRKDGLTMKQKDLAIKYNRRPKYIQEVMSRKLWPNI